MTSCDASEISYHCSGSGPTLNGVPLPPSIGETGLVANCSRRPKRRSQHDGLRWGYESCWSCDVLRVAENGFSWRSAAPALSGHDWRMTSRSIQRGYYQQTLLVQYQYAFPTSIKPIKTSHMISQTEMLLHSVKIFYCISYIPNAAERFNKKPLAPCRNSYINQPRHRRIKRHQGIKKTAIVKVGKSHV